MERLHSQWQKLPVSLAELCIDTTLRCGQSFRWRKFGDEWRCGIYGRIISLKQDAESVYFRAIIPEKAAAAASASSPLLVATHVAREPFSNETELFLRSYFNLHLDLRALYQQWSRDDPNFRKKAPKFSGIRILNQDAWEALVCFICSSNNNISRISQMVQKLCLHYGQFLGTADGELYHDFPSPIALAAPHVENHLRQLGFGYRAKYIAQTAKTIVTEKPPGWLLRLRNSACPPWPRADVDDAPGVDTQSPLLGGASTYRNAHEQLLLLSGVGPKVADCVCLMGLGWGEAVPVDTHVWQIAVRDYKFKKSSSKAFSKAIYDSVGEHFRRLWGSQAGWAQSVLFTANLRAFADRLKTEVADEGSTTPNDTTNDVKKRKAYSTEGEVKTKLQDAVTAVESKRKRRKRG